MVTQGGTMALASRRNREAGKREVVLYWVFTVLLLAQIAVTGIALVLRPPAITVLIRHLGYPEYFPLLLGIAKLLAVVAIVQPWSAMLKEWGYAGVTFDAVAALFSHISSHDPAKDIAGPLVVMVLIALSYFNYVKVRGRV